MAIKIVEIRTCLCKSRLTRNSFSRRRFKDTESIRLKTEFHIERNNTRWTILIGKTTASTMKHNRRRFIITSHLNRYTFRMEIRRISSTIGRHLHGVATTRNPRKHIVIAGAKRKRSSNLLESIVDIIQSRGNARHPKCHYTIRLAGRLHNRIAYSPTLIARLPLAKIGHQHKQQESKD